MRTPPKKALILFVGLGLSILFASAQAENLSQRPDVQAFIQTMVQQDHFSAKSLNKLFDEVELQPKIIVLISNPAEKKDWPFYRKRFITDKRVSEGYRFWQNHYKVLARIQQQYGVPASVIVAILGVETFYGERQGEYRVMDALTTLAFDYPPRQKFFQKELAEYLRLTREQDIAPLSLKGSYAGAIGMPQFMPSSYRKYAVAYKAPPHHINLQKNTNNILASVANYLQQNGWQRGQPIMTKTIVTQNSALATVVPNTPPTKTLGELRALGFKVDSQYNSALPANIVQLATPDGPLYEMGFTNFYTIMRYNTSVNYAMAVYMLSTVLDECWQAKLPRCDIS